MLARGLIVGTLAFLAACRVREASFHLPSDDAGEVAGEDGGGEPVRDAGRDASRDAGIVDAVVLFCGDGIVTLPDEQCDPGGGPTPFDTATCDSDCTLSACGDGHTNLAAAERCDDGNNDSCGTCAVGCLFERTPAAAIGLITTAAAFANGGNISDGDTFALDDGFHPTVVFEFDVGGDGTVGAGHIAIVLLGDGSENAAAVASGVKVAIDAQRVVSRLDLVPSIGGNGEVVQLANTHKSSRGNKLIQRSGNIATSFTFVDMSGGLAGDCDAGIGCGTAADCASGICNTTTHHCQ